MGQDIKIKIIATFLTALLLVTLLLAVFSTATSHTNTTSEGNDPLKETITVSLQTGTGVEKLTTSLGSILEEPHPEVEGYLFDGWYTDPYFTVRFDFSRPIVDNVYLYGKFLQKPSVPEGKCIVSFNATGGTAQHQFLEVTTGSTIAEPAIPMKTNFEFRGWFVDSRYTIAWNFETDVVLGNMTLYAKWINDRLDYNPSVYTDTAWVYTYSQDGKMYTVIYRGTVNGVILAELSNPHYVISEMDTINVTKTVTEEQTITNSVTNTTGESTSNTHKAGVEINPTKLLQRIPVVGAFIPDLTFQYGYEHTKTNYSEISNTYSEAHATAHSVAIGSTHSLSNVGLYRYAMYATVGDLDIYQTYVIDQYGNVSTHISYFTRNCINKVVAADTTDEFKFKYEFPVQEIFVDSGSGVKNDPYKIENLGQFTTIASKPNAYYVLQKDIDLSRVSQWVPLRTFGGNLNGNDKILSNLKVNIPDKSEVSSEDKYYGLFRAIDGTVSNLKVVNFNIYFGTGLDKSGWVYAGFLTATGRGNITNVTVVDSIMFLNLDRSSMGGVAGHFTGKISNTSVLGCYLFSNGDIGGIVGTLSSTNGVVDNCTVTKNGSKYTEIYYWAVNNNRSTGGIVGYAVNGGKIQNSFVTYVKFTVNGVKELKPTQGYIVGHLSSGTIYKVGAANNITDCKIVLKKTGGFLGIGDYNYAQNYFSVGWGYAGRLTGSNTIV